MIVQWNGARRARKVVRNGLILLTYLSGLPTVRDLLRRRAWRPVTRILCLHKIPDRAAFERKIEAVCRHYNVVRLEDFAAGRLSSEQINVCVTFDDGYASWLNAIPFLERCHVPATFFVCSGYLDCETPEAWEHFCRARLGLRLPEPNISWEDARHLAHHPLFRVGGHTRNHKSLGELVDPGEILREVELDKQILEERLCGRIEHFAYPFGYPPGFLDRVRTGVMKAGYRLAATLIPGPNTDEQDRFLLHRDGLDEVHSAFLIRAWLDGSYDFWKAIQIGGKIRASGS